MINLLIDTSVLVKWFHAEGESELAPARALRSAHLAGDVEALVIDLAYYEVGNVLTRALKWPATDVADQLDDLRAILGEPVPMTASWLRPATAVAQTHQLLFYDASWAAAAAELGISLISADGRLVEAGLAESATETFARLRLPTR